MSAECFMVPRSWDMFIDGGGKRVGAMAWRWHELEPYDADPRPMPHLAVMTAAGMFCIDCPDSDPPHGYWTRSGAPPNVTVTPSINVNPEAVKPEHRWHGYLTGGTLTP